MISTEDKELELLHATIGHYSRMLSDVQKVRIAMSNRAGAMERNEIPPEWSIVTKTAADNLESTENSLNNMLQRLARRHFMRDWIEAQPGIGLAGFARLLGIIGPLTPYFYHGQDCGCDPENEKFLCPADGSIAGGFPNVAKLWHYLGLHVEEGAAPKRHKGEKLSYSPQGRTLCYLFGEAIVKVGHGEYREAYDRKKAYYAASRTDWTPLHCHRAAMRYAVKELIKNLWVEWHRRRPAIA